MSPPVDLVALTLLPAGRARIVAERLRAQVSPAEILREQCEAPLGGRAVEKPDAARLCARAEAALGRAERLGVALVTWGDPDYPPFLAAIVDPPAALWVWGDRAIFRLPTVALVGARGGSPYALTVAAELSADLAARGLLVASGFARGVDSAAHRGALSVNGRTVAVLGNGVDVVYPSEHRSLAAEIIRSGALVSEFVPGTAPHRRFFPQRNRIISGLSRAVVVVEAGERSGSLITARFALEQGRDVLAVPGNILSGRNRGGHALLRDGAKVVESAADILEELGLTATAARVQTIETTDPVLACFPRGESCDLDTIVARSGLPVTRLLPRLSELELEGRVGRIGGGRFVRVDRSC
jgi:DNA processing protein